MLQFSDNDNDDKAYLGGAHLVVMKWVRGKSVTLDTLPFIARDGASYTIRFRAQGNQLLARALPIGTVDSGTWTVAVTNGSLALRREACTSCWSVAPSYV